MFRALRLPHALLASTISLCGFATIATPAYADDREQCVSAADKAQVLRDEGKYTKAREQMLLCSRDVCPGLIKKDCVQWLADIEKSAPTVVVSARDGERDLSEVRVFLDGILLAERLDGKPLVVDPGAHKFRFEHSGTVKEQEPVIRAGEKNRIISVQFGAPVAPSRALEQPAPAPATTTTSSSAVPAVMLGGVGVIALGTAGFFWISGLGDKSTLEDTCGRTKSCTESDISPARTKLIVGDIAGGVGVVSLVVATYLFLSRSKGEAAVSTKTGLNVTPVPGGAAAAFGASF